MFIFWIENKMAYNTTIASSSLKKCYLMQGGPHARTCVYSYSGTLSARLSELDEYHLFVRS